MPACLAFWIGTTTAAVSSTSATIRSGFLETAWLKFWTWAPGVHRGQVVDLDPRASSAASNVSLYAEPQGLSSP